MPGNHIGGAKKNAGNLISGNKGSGVFITGKAARLNRIEGNFIGTNGDGDLPIGNEMSGVHIHNAPDNFIGDVDRDSGNLISCNSEGIRISGAYATGNKIQSNIIGSKKDGKTMLEVRPVRSGEGSYYIKTGNDMGVLIEASHNLVGTEKGRNVISGNTSDGILIQPEILEDRFQHFPSGNKIQNNFIGVDVDGKTRSAQRSGRYRYFFRF